MKLSKRKSGKKKKTGGAHWRLITSIVLTFLGFFTLIAQISYLFHWKKDFNIVDLDIKSEPASNIFGKVGVVIGHSGIYDGFGVASMLISLMLILTGFHVFQKKHWFRILVRWIWTLFYVAFFSVLLSLLFPENPILGGIGGIEAAELLTFYLGRYGSLILWGILALILIVYKFKLEPEHLDSAIKKLTPSATLVKGRNLFNRTARAKNKEETAPSDEKRDTEEHTTTSGAPEKDISITVKGHRTESEETAEEPIERPETKVSSAEKDEKSFEIIVTEDELVDKPSDVLEEFGEFDPTLELSDYKFPHFDLLKDYANVEVALNEQELLENNKKIVKTLSDFGIEIEKIEANVGPSVTLYEIIPKPGVRISKIKNLEDDIAMSLAALGIRIIAPMPGRGTIGIEVPNKNPVLVPLKRVLRSKKFQNAKMELPIALGKTISNDTYVFDLAKMPHLLIAGATGQGKSVGLNVIINSLLFKKHPAELKFVMVDPKKVELSLYNTIERHFLAKLPDNKEAIISDVSKVKDTLNSLIVEMENRYLLLQKAKVRNVVEYNRKFKERKLNPNNGHRYLPYIVLIIDEFGDFIMTAGKEVELPIARLAQMARAVGIHMIIATQRPSVNIITGIIKANFPARIAFRVSSQVDSRTILDQSGADQLVGKGDLLITTGSDLTRLQCAFIDTDEVERVTEFIGAQRGYPAAYELPEPESTESLKDELEDDERDPLFKEAAYIIVNAQQGSASLLQRKLKIGYNRAGRLIDQMERAGIVGPSEGSKPRQVNISTVEQLDKFFENL